MEWCDEGVVLSARRHGETSAIAEILTLDHGRCLGLVRGGRSRQQRPVLQPGNAVKAVWRARLEEHLGQFTLDPLRLSAGSLMEDRLSLAALSTLTSLAQALPEREPHQRLYQALHIVLQSLMQGGPWPALMVRWEMGLLDELGFGLDLQKCAVTGAMQDLCYVSPKSGRAVCAGAGAPYKSRLFVLPEFLRAEQNATPTSEDVLDGFRLTGYFIDRHIYAARGLSMPASRQRMIEYLQANAAVQKDAVS